MVDVAVSGSVVPFADDPDGLGSGDDAGVFVPALSASSVGSSPYPADERIMWVDEKKRGFARGMRVIVGMAREDSMVDRSMIVRNMVQWCVFVVVVVVELPET